MTRKKIGLALSGGGARGFAHVGVLKAFADNGVPVDYIAGTSAGSFVGGAFAAGMSVDEIIELGKKISWLSVAGFSYSPRGLLSNRPMSKFIERHFPVQRFEDLLIPFAAVACDLKCGTEIVYRDTGDLKFAIRASCSVPAVFAPLIDADGRTVVDGGVVSPLPVNAVREMGADIVIAVDVLACGTNFERNPITLIGAFMQSAMTLIRTAAGDQHERADIVIKPPIAHIRQDQLRKMDEMIGVGERAAALELDKIKSLLRQPIE